uniref:Major latex n=1 Tax=Solanum tuberosum TaxID=4113 RepID=M0ZNM2_SOLTU
MVLFISHIVFSPPSQSPTQNHSTFLNDSYGYLTLFFCKAEGKKKISKQIIETIDHEKKVLTFKEFEGDVVDIYDNFKSTLHIETKGEIDLISWTIEYERPNENVPELVNFLDFIVGITKAVDDHHVKMN